MKDDVIIDYTNWRGERRGRKVRPIGIKFCSTPHHADDQWIMFAIDTEESEAMVKAFAMTNIHSLKSARGA
jgi:hypothetical protein